MQEFESTVIAKHELEHPKNVETERKFWISHAVSNPKKRKKLLNFGCRKSSPVKNLAIDPLVEEI